MKKTLGFPALCVLAVAIGAAFVALDARAAAPAGTSTETSTFATRETIACNSGVSPCTVAASATTILNANAGRHTACLQHSGSAGIAYCTLGATVPSATVHDFLLGAPGNATGYPTTFCISGGITVWGGVLSCFGGTGVSLDVLAY